MDDYQNTAVLIPAYNEAKTIEKIVNQCLRYTQHVIVINDGSTDETASLLGNTTATVVTNSINSGKGAALLTGFQVAIEQQYQGVITIDADGQHNPHDLPCFLKLIAESADSFIIGARRFSTQHAPKKRLFANKLADFFISLAARKRLFDTQSGFRYYPVSFLKKYITQKRDARHFAFEADILIAAVKAGLSIQYVNIASCYPADARASHFHPGKDTWEIAKTILKLILNPSS